MKFGGLMSKYLLYKPKKFEIKTLSFGRVIEKSLGVYFFMTHSVYWLKNRTIIGNNYSGFAISIYLKLKNNEDKTSCIQ